jgi:hypothetical protein
VPAAKLQGTIQNDILKVGNGLLLFWGWCVARS